MRKKLLNIGLILTSLLGYLEWGGDNSMFLGEAEAEIIGKLFTDPLSVIHPFVILPLFGQLLLLYSLIQKTHNKLLTYLGMGSIGLLLLFLFFIGLMSFNWKSVLSTLPFIILSVLTVLEFRKKAGKS